MPNQVRVSVIDDLDLSVEAYDWPFLTTHHDAIKAYWAERVKTLSAIYDNQMLLLCDGCVQEKQGRRIFTGACFETAYSAFLYWRSRNDVTSSIKNIYAMAALQSSDGAYILGEMAPNTANAGAVYFPAGTPDLHDIKDGKLDLEFNVWRELYEETGLTQVDVAAQDVWTFVESGHHAAFFKAIRSPLDSQDLTAKITAHLAKDDAPEFVKLHVVQSKADLEGRNIPIAVKVFLASVL